MAFCLNALEGHAEGIRVADGRILFQRFPDVVSHSKLSYATGVF
jgi:hypothetical protein